MRRILAFAVIVIGALIVLFLLVYLVSPNLPGFHYKPRSEDYWIAFWSALWAGVIIAVPIAAAVAVLLGIWERGNRGREALEDTRRELDIAKEQLKYPLSLPKDWRGRAAPPELTTLVPKIVTDSGVILDSKPLHYWKEQLQHRRDDAGTVQKMINLQAAYREYLTKETSATQAVDYVVQGGLGGSFVNRSTTVIPCLAHALGHIEREITPVYGYAVNTEIYGRVIADTSANGALDAFRKADEALWIAVTALQQDLGIV